MVALFVAGVLWQPSINTPKIVEQVTRPLTSKEVFASARQLAVSQADLKEGQWFYQKQLVTQGQTETCDVNTEIRETYRRTDGTVVWRRLNEKTGALIESMIRGDDGNSAYANGKDNHFFDRSAVDPTMLDTMPDCNLPTWADDEYSKKYNAHLEAVARAFNYKEKFQNSGLAAGGKIYLKDLESGNPKRQAETLDKLQNLNEWEVKQNQTKDGYNGKVIILAFEAGPNYRENIYFDQQTKQYVGIETADLPWGFTRSTVVESGIRSYEIE